MGITDIPALTSAAKAKKIMSALKGETITLPKARALMKELGTVDDAAAKFLKESFRHAGKDKYSPAAAALFKDFIDGKTGPGHLRDPALDPENQKKKHRWVEVKGTLALDVAKGDDVQQNGLGDCFYLSSLAATVHTAEIWAKHDGVDRNYASEILKLQDPDQPNEGDISKRWFFKDKDGVFHERWQKMTRDLPVDDNGDLLMAGDKRHLWVAFDEKGAAAAFPKAMSGADDPESAKGYGRMDGGWAGTAIQPSRRAHLGRDEDHHRA